MMSVGAWLLVYNGPEEVSFSAVEFRPIHRFTNLLFEPRYALRGLTLLLFAASTETSRSTRVPFPLLISDLGSSLDIDWNLDIVTLLTLDSHKLNATLTTR